LVLVARLVPPAVVLIRAGEEQIRYLTCSLLLGAVVVAQELEHPAV
jgi:hypothetical protein